LTKIADFLVKFLIRRNRSGQSWLSTKWQFLWMS